MKQIMFTVYGEPVAKGRPRFTRQGRTYTPVKTKSYESEVAALAKAAMQGEEPLKTPVAVFIHATFSVPLSYSKKRRSDCLAGYERHTKRPDADNIAKAITDAMNGVVYEDDSQIVILHVVKLYGTDGRVEVFVQEELP